MSPLTPKERDRFRDDYSRALARDDLTAAAAVASLLGRSAVHVRRDALLLDKVRKAREEIANTDFKKIKRDLSKAEGAVSEQQQLITKTLEPLQQELEQRKQAVREAKQKQDRHEQLTAQIKTITENKLISAALEQQEKSNV